LGDAYIFKLYVLSQDRNLEWFPRLRAKSLAADEGEGEQVELRSLQSQLESTQMLVKCLSQQLTELRDQVIVIIYIIIHYTYVTVIIPQITLKISEREGTVK